jgi:hypothetical protein
METAARRATSSIVTGIDHRLLTVLISRSSEIVRTMHTETVYVIYTRVSLFKLVRFVLREKELNVVTFLHGYACVPIKRILYLLYISILTALTRYATIAEMTALSIIRNLN